MARTNALTRMDNWLRNNDLRRMELTRSMRGALGATILAYVLLNADTGAYQPVYTLLASGLQGTSDAASGLS